MRLLSEDLLPFEILFIVVLSSCDVCGNVKVREYLGLFPYFDANSILLPAHVYIGNIEKVKGKREEETRRERKK
jgi:hypothetical protein